ncbi:class I SAM-dependent methyltransferase [Deltaproteobacteria bacterium]|nr:class I SAM-dependent methyltransferase [Deltaproteobacteria bacterium]
MRACEVCNSISIEQIHTQKFIVPDEENIFSYTVAACKNCGFIFAVDIPSQEQYEKYYKLNTRYIYKADKGIVPEGIRKIHYDSFSLIEGFLKENNPFINKETFRILDIGCSTGYLLHIFKERGYKNILGLDPAQECAEIAHKLYGIKVISCPLSQYVTNDQYDLIIMSGVLEHINDISDNLSMVSALLKDDGILFVMVPDAENFSADPCEPFHEFSLEHTNFITKNSLSNLMGKHGFINKLTESIEIRHYDSYALATFWVKTWTKMSIRNDISGILKVKQYISRSSKKLKTLQDKIEKLVESQEKVAVWGVGSLTSRLLATTNLGKANIEAFVDSNPSLHGRKIKGIEIVYPQSLLGKNLTVFISTYVYSNVIKNILINKYHFQGKIVLIAEANN